MRLRVVLFHALSLIAASCVVPGAQIDATLDGSAGSAGSGGTPSNGGGGSGASTTSCTPGAAEACWESPDGVPFEGEAPTSEQATCRAGQRKCEGDATWGACLGAVGPEPADTCDPGNDGNCNGFPNEGCSCEDGDERACGSDQGNCKPGKQTCVDKVWGACVGQIVQAASDACEPNDDANCDGMPNEGCECINGDQKACGTDIGPCEFGTKICVNGVYPEACEGGVSAADKDTCEPGNDADCNNTVNEGCGCTGTAPRACGVTQGACEVGMQTCTDGTLSGCSVTPTTNDTCFAADDANDTNCNGTYRDGCECVATDAPKRCPDASGCGVQTCDGATGKWSACTGDGETLRCNPAAPDSRQICNENGVWTNDLCPAGSACRGDAVCKLLDGQPCTAAADCDSNACNSFYLDADKDGYAANTTIAKFCGTTKTGYVTQGANKGTDCSDGNANINPGKTEVCDGVDNDCDDKIDLADGLTLVNAVADVGPAANARYQPEIAWSAEKNVYGIVYGDDTAATEGVYFTALNQAGVVQTAPLNAASRSDGFAISLAWGTDNFGLAWFNDGDVNFRTLGSNGALGVTRVVANGALARPHVARVGTGSWGIAYLDYASGSGYVSAKTVSPAGAISGVVQVALQNTSVGLLVGTSTNFVAAVDVVSMNAKASVYSATLGMPAALVVSGTSPVMGRGPSGFAIAVQKGAGNQPEFYSYDDGGNASCGPVKFADSSFVPTDAVGTADGYVVVGGKSGTIRAQLIKHDCSLGPLFTVDATGGNYARISGGAAGYGVVWEAASQKVKRRFFGPNLCD